VWRSLGSGVIEAKYLFYATQPPEKLEQLPQGWGPAGHGEIVEQLKLAPDHKMFESSLTPQLFDQSGRVVPGGGAARGAGLASTSDGTEVRAPDLGFLTPRGSFPVCRL
jgi:hypothetical protein